MQGNTGKVKYTALVLCKADTFEPVLDAAGQQIVKPNTPGDPDYLPMEFSEVYCPPPEIPEESGCPFNVTGISLDTFNPDYNTVILGLSNPSIDRIAIEVLQNDLIITPAFHVDKQDEYFHVKLNKNIVGSITLRVVVESMFCVRTTNINITAAPPTTVPQPSTTLPPPEYECFTNFAIYRRADASGPETINVKYYDCAGEEQIIGFTKGAPALCISYQYRGPGTFTAVNPSEQSYLNAYDISIGVLVCGAVLDTTSTSTTTSTTTTSTTTQGCPEKNGMPSVFYRGKAYGVPYPNSEQAELGAFQGSGFGDYGQLPHVNPSIGDPFYETEFSDCKKLKAGWYWYSYTVVSPDDNPTETKKIVEIDELGHIVTIYTYTSPSHNTF